MLPWPHTTAGPLCAEAAKKHLVPNRTAIWPQSESDSGQFRYDLKEAEEDGEGGGREGDAGPPLSPLRFLHRGLSGDCVAEPGRARSPSTVGPRN